jgi:glc operon protein GlcG
VFFDRKEDLMSDVKPGSRIAEAAVLKMLKAAVLEARRLKEPAGIAIVDPSGLLRAWVLMDDAVPLAADIVPKKARTAVYTGVPTGDLPAELAAKLTAATAEIVDLPGGLPIVINGEVVGAIAAGARASETDVAIARAGLAALEPVGM